MFNPHLIPLCTHSLPPALHLRRKVTRTAVEEPLVESGGWSLLPLRLVLGNPQPPRNLRSEFVPETAYWNFFFTKGAGKESVSCLFVGKFNCSAVPMEQSVQLPTQGLPMGWLGAPHGSQCRQQTMLLMIHEELPMKNEKRIMNKKMSCWCFPLFFWFYSASGPLGLCFTSGPEPSSQQPSPHRHGWVLAHKPSANHGETWIGSTE